ncbi:thioredoxin family protein [Aurantimonas sp. C2-6-R+9]|uniref:thioredoxin family protein n=1 Tax=unclassified Aurantimonas TaxID=2638230 RepID=UPI002E17ACA8|nr:MULTISPECIES: thioredoxin family protein [unclassified Aurantimonas]MEC5289208.1 thioredoxin family protein [Aurantimonas sp. C2-3-R2]MEC5323072.1 thioredoxin family protein [Aurantimonas sp. A3-2-R12]MEC5380156.1 thioredoxin family protein [Aurantimonas sp. C2-6-R+9]MEC5410342.1 thioredoxin family protein [Aurantimonas sp. C2-4-R8]
MLRQLLIASAFIGVLAGSAYAVEIGDDGLHKQDWFSLTFKDVAEDIQAAKDEDKRLVLVFEQRGCIYCKKMHEELLTNPEVRDYIQANFKVVQYNLFGDEEVTDIDGETLTEKSAGRRWAVVFTPTILFMPEEVPEEGTAGEAAVATMPGLFGKQTFLHMFEWVRTKGYDGDEHFQKYHARRLEEKGLIDAQPAN